MNNKKLLRDKADRGDVIYLTATGFSIPIILKSWDFFYSSITTHPIPRGLSFYFVTIIILLLFFWFLRLIAVFYEIKLLKYLSEHGLSYSIMLFILFPILIAPSVILGKYMFSIFLLIGSLYLFLKIALSIDKILANRLLESERYSPLKEEYKENTYLLTRKFYFALLCLALAIVFCHIFLFNLDDIPYISTKIFFIFIFIFLIGDFIVNSYDFHKLIYLKQPKFKEDLINFLKPLPSKFYKSIRRKQNKKSKV